jgi:uncharacterized protein
VIVPDVNLLLYAYDSTSPFHKLSREWWEKCLTGSEPVGLTHPVVFAFVRIGTSARAFLRPMSLAEVSTHVTSWLSRRITRVLHPDPAYVENVLKLLQAASSAGGNLVTDAQVAALALAHKGTVHTADHDFERFKGLECCFPLDE